MKCSNLTRCDKPKIIYFENIYFCQNCDGVYQFLLLMNHPF